MCTDLAHERGVLCQRQHISARTDLEHEGGDAVVGLDLSVAEREPLCERDVVGHRKSRPERHVQPPQRPEQLQRLHVLCLWKRG
eukprot:655129-Rhodomonas_salina.1